MSIAKTDEPRPRANLSVNPRFVDFLLDCAGVAREIDDQRLYTLCMSMAALQQAFFSGQSYVQCGHTFRAELRQRGYSQFDIDDLLRKTESLKQPESMR